MTREQLMVWGRRLRLATGIGVGFQGVANLLDEIEAVAGELMDAAEGPPSLDEVIWQAMPDFVAALAMDGHGQVDAFREVPSEVSYPHLCHKGRTVTGGADVKLALPRGWAEKNWKTAVWPRPAVPPKRGG